MKRKPRLTEEELELTKDMIRPTVAVMRRVLLAKIGSEKARHWKMRGTHRLGKHFERGFFRGLKHADGIIRDLLDPKRYQAKIRQAR